MMLAQCISSDTVGVQNSQTPGTETIIEHASVGSAHFITGPI